MLYTLCSILYALCSEALCLLAAADDPASWYGLPEFDLALLELRGRFGPRFYDGATA